jgi:hypothetical protein
MNEKISCMENELNVKEKMLVGKHIEIMELENQIKKRKHEQKENDNVNEKPEKSSRVEIQPSPKAQPRNIVGATNTIHVAHEDYSKNINDKLKIETIIDYLISSNIINSRHDYITGQATNKCIFMKFKHVDVVDKLVDRKFFTISHVDVKISRARTELQWLPSM